MTLDTRARGAAQGIRRAVEMMETSTSSTEPTKLERLDRYRYREQRNRRLGAILVAAALMIAIALAATRALNPERGPVPAEPPEGSDQPTWIGMVHLSEAKCRLFTLDGPFRAGLVQLSAVNVTDAVVAFDLVRFVPERLTYEQFTAYVERERRRAEAAKVLLQPLPDHTRSRILYEEVRPGRSEPMTGTVRAGTYAVMCLRTFEDGAGLRPFDLVGPIELE